MSSNNSSTNNTNKKKRRVDDPTNTEPSLLHLPLDDFISITAQIPTVSSSSSFEIAPNDSEKKENNRRDSLLLLQLPPTLSFDTFLQATLQSSDGTIRSRTSTSSPSIKTDENVQIIIREDTLSEDMEPSSSSSMVANTCMILPKLGKTFALTRVETSNTYVLVSPQHVHVESSSSSSSLNLHTTAPTTGNATTSSSSSSMIVPTIIMQARLLHEQDTFIIESIDISNQLIQTQKGKFQLIQYLKQFLFPLKEKGCTFHELQQQFTCTEIEISDALVHIHAFSFPSTKLETTFGWIQEEFFYLAIQAILYTLNDGDVSMTLNTSSSSCCTDTVFTHYATKGIHVSTFIQHAIEQLNSLWIHVSLSVDQSYALIYHILFHYMKQQHSQNGDSDNTTFDYRIQEDEYWLLHSHKIAIFVAKILFLQQTTWKVKEFIDQWHSHIPGVGNMYQPDISILKGLCIVLQHPQKQQEEDETTSIHVQFQENSSSTEEILFYLPHESLPIQPQGRFQKLFQIQSKWRWDDLEPYIASMMDCWNENDYDKVKLDAKDPKVVSIWMKYANVIEDLDKKSTGEVWYIAK